MRPYTLSKKLLSSLGDGRRPSDLVIRVAILFNLQLPVFKDRVQPFRANECIVYQIRPLPRKGENRGIRSFRDIRRKREDRTRKRHDTEGRKTPGTPRTERDSARAGRRIAPNRAERTDEPALSARTERKPIRASLFDCLVVPNLQHCNLTNGFHVNVCAFDGILQRIPTAIALAGNMPHDLRIGDSA